MNNFMCIFSFFPDNNECNANAGLGPCISPATCYNNVGSFRCQCPSGYRLNGDGVTCDSKCARLKILRPDALHRFVEKNVIYKKYKHGPFTFLARKLLNTFKKAKENTFPINN